jgi:nucleoside-diphosphate-sugar epimerase
LEALLVNAAVTGGTGFLGQFLLPALMRQGGRVRALVRRREDADLLKALGVVPIDGDLTQPGGCDRLVEPSDVVFHAAARVDMTGSWREFSTLTIEGTRRLLETALPQRPRRFVYISSAGVYARPRTLVPVSADRDAARPSPYNLYGRAKLAAELLVRRLCTEAGCPWVILRLGFLYGPGNQALFRRLAPLLRTGRLFIIGNGRNRIATLHVEDAVAAVLAAGIHPEAPGHVYDVASSELVTQQEFLDGSADALGLPRCRRHVPYRLAFLAAGLTELWTWISGRTPPFTRAMVALLAAEQVIDASRIVHELGCSPRIRFADSVQAGAWAEGLNGLDTI